MEVEVLSKLGILYIGLGDYIVFWDEFYRSFEEKFLVECDKEYFVFTDRIDSIQPVKDKVNVIAQENLGWPGNTLYRFDMFLSIKDRLVSKDYVFFFNANYMCSKEVILEDVNDLKASLTVVEHPGFQGRRNYYFNYDRNKKSLAYIPYGEGEHYVQGCLIGGKPDCFIKMCSILSENIHSDDANGVIAEWHDESHLNRYICDNRDYYLLDPGFAYPEFTVGDRDYSPKLVLRDKEKYITYVGKKRRSKYWLYYKKKILVGCLHEVLDKVGNRRIKKSMNRCSYNRHG